MNAEDRKVLEDSSEKLLGRISKEHGNFLILFAETAAVFCAPTTVFIKTLKDTDFGDYENLAAGVLASLIVDATDDIDEAMRMVNGIKDRLEKCDREIVKG